MDWEQELDELEARRDAKKKNESGDAEASARRRRRAAYDAVSMTFEGVIVPALKKAEAALRKKGYGCRADASSGTDATDGFPFTDGAILAIVRRGQLPQNLDWDNDVLYSRLTFKCARGSTECYIASQVQGVLSPSELEKISCSDISKAFVEQKLRTFVAQAIGA